MGTFLILAALEFIIPRVQRHSPLQRWAANVGLWAIFNGLMIWLEIMGVFGAAVWASEHRFGVFRWLSIPVIPAGIAGLLLLDFSSWLRHLCAHRYALLWRLHSIHHSDLECDVSTAIRNHPLEAFLSTAWNGVTALVFGISPGAVVIYTLTYTAVGMLNHANIQFPGALDRLLRYVLITPGLHRNHHAREMALQMTNYGAMFSIWDRLLGTWSEPADVSMIGVDNVDERQAANLVYLTCVLPLKNP